jgi:hypothetical protein
MIPVITLPPEPMIAFPETNSRMLVHQLFQKHHYRLIVLLLGDMLICTGRYLYRFAGPMGA